MKRRGGFSLMELLIVLSLMGLLAGLVAPGTRHWRDAAATRAARDELAAELSWARLAAAGTGGATVIIDPRAATVRVVGGDSVERAAVDLDERWGVSMDTGGVEPAHIDYDPLGIGRFANRTVRLRRGAAVAGVTVSAYGRVRRW